MEDRAGDEGEAAPTGPGGYLEDLDGRGYIAVTVDDDPGKDLGRAGQPGHRFFFSPAEVEVLGE
jgi:hypothetical protein